MRSLGERPSSSQTPRGSGSNPRRSLDTLSETTHGQHAEHATQTTPCSADAIPRAMDMPFVGRPISAPGSKLCPPQISRFFFVELDRKHTDIILIVCSFVGGLVDGLSFNAWGSFSSMQTGKYSICIADERVSPYPLTNANRKHRFHCPRRLWST